jgi:hypothetical protein
MSVLDIYIGGGGNIAVRLDDGKIRAGVTDIE